MPPTLGMMPTTSVNGSARSWKSFNCSVENENWKPPVSSPFGSAAMTTICSGCGRVRGRSVALSIPYSAVLAPRPIASVSTAAAVNALCVHRNRMAYRRSVTGEILVDRAFSDGLASQPVGSTRILLMKVRLWIAAGLLCAAAAHTRAQAPGPVAGIVFEDTNRNRQRDPGERALGGVAVSNQREVVQTAADGSYSLPRGPYGLVFISVPDGYVPVGDFWRVVPGPADFPLTPQQTSATFTFMHASDTHVSRQTI